MIELRWLKLDPRDPRFGERPITGRVLQYRYKPDLPAIYGDADIAWSDWIDVPEVNGE